ncbi:MAG: MmcQ/YjbR family DNA-binding protein [Duganella sp.]
MNLIEAQALCRSLPGATEDIKWESTLAFSVGGKMFAATWNVASARHLSFKVDDDRFLALTDRPGIIPAPYLARAKWIRIENIQTIRDAELTELIQRAHELVLNRLTKKLQREILGIAR